MAPRRIAPAGLVDCLPERGLVWLQATSAESRLIAEGLAQCGGHGGLTITGIFVPGINRLDQVLSGGHRMQVFFMTPELRNAGDRVEFLPLCYRDILAHSRQTRIDAALFMVSPPDTDGICSFGSAVDFLAEIWPRIPLRIAHVNPRMPRTRGHPGIPYAALDAVMESEEELLSYRPGTDETSLAIGRHVAGLVADGATVQTGLGRVPEIAMAALSGHRNLRVHTGLIGDAVLDLLEVGALAAGSPVTTGVAIGTRRLYDALPRPEFAFRPVSYTHATATLSGLERLVTINSVVAIDLLGQGYSELMPAGLYSGPGGAPDFAAGAHQAGGLRIVALPSTAAGGEQSRIVAPGAGRGPVCLTRFDIDVVATEHGIADLRGKGHEARAKTLIDIADPRHRGTLGNAWENFHRALR